MNKIIFAGALGAGSERYSKNFEILVAHSGGEISGGAEFQAGNCIIVPPRKNYKISADCTLIILEKAVLPISGITVICDDANAGIAHAAAQAVEYFNGDAPKKQLILAALGNLLGSYITAFTAKSGYSPAVDKAIAEISEKVSDCTYSIDDSLKKMPLNYDYIRKLFKKEVGITPREYLLKERMSLASGLILSGISNRYSSYTVSQIAEACGYSDPLYFSRVFKAYFGVPPTEYGK